MTMNKLKLTGLWKNTSKDGQIFYSGSLSPTVRVLVFKNNFKKEDRDPDLVLYLAPADKKEDAFGDAAVE
jgi:hypothetical protein